MTKLGVILCGFITGSVMTVPGISGGSAAMVIGIYDELVRSVSRLFSEPGKSIPLLLFFSAGASVGMLIVARLMSFLLTTPAEIPLRFMFMGAVAGSIPMIFRKAGIRKLDPRSIMLILSGASSVLLLSLIPDGLFSPGGSGLSAFLFQVTGGVLLAAALVLPGVSASHFLYILGIYDPVMEKLGSVDLLSLLPLACGVLLGIFLTARILEKLIERHRTGTFLVILGFVLASLRELFPQGSGLLQISIGIPCILVGFVPVYVLQKERRKKHKSEEFF